MRRAAAEADWVFVHQHHPLFTDATLIRNDKAFQNLLLPIFVRYGVDVVFAGHEHLLSQFELNAPDNHSGPVVQVISGSGSKLHLQNHRCCSIGTVPSCGSDIPPCPSKNCLFQRTIHGFVLVELSMKQMRLHFIDAATGDVINHSTYESKKASRLLNATAETRPNGEDVTEAAQVEPAGAYPTISRVLVPKELTGGRLNENVKTTWILLVALGVTALLCFFCYRRCGELQRCLSRGKFCPSLSRWRRARQCSFESIAPPTVLVEGVFSSDSREDDSKTSGGLIPLVAVVSDAAGACELRKQRAEDGISLV